MTDDVLLDCPVLAWSVAALFERDMGREVLRGGTAPRSGGAIVVCDYDEVLQRM